MEPATASALWNWDGPGSSKDTTVFTCRLAADKRFPGDLTWSWGDDKQAQRAEPWATVHRSESQTHPGPKLRYHAPGSTLLSWRPQAEATTAPEGKVAQVPEEAGKAQAKSPISEQATLAPVHQARPLPPSHPCASSQQGLRELPAQAHTHPPPPVPVEADLIKVVPAPKTDNTG